MTTRGEDGVYRTTDLVRQTPGGGRALANGDDDDEEEEEEEEEEENLIALADCPSYLNSPLHATTLVHHHHTTLTV